MYWRKLTGDLCAPIAFGQALQRTGQKLYIPLHEIANAIGQPLSTLWADGMNMAHLAEPMRRFGLQFDTFGGGWIAKLDDVFTKAKAADGPIMIGIGGIRQVTTASGALGKAESCHVVLVSKTLTGVKIIDRYGVFSTFEELARRYGVLGDLYINPTRPVFVLKNAVVDEKLLKLADLSSPLACLSRMSLAMFDFNRQRVSPEFVKQDFRRFAESGGSSKNKSTMAN